MKTVRMKIDVQSPNAKPSGHIDVKRVDATTEADIANHQAEDDANAMMDSAKFARRVRRRLGFSQAEFAERIDVSLDTIRNWEQGKRCPTGCGKGAFEGFGQSARGCFGGFAVNLHGCKSCSDSLWPVHWGDFGYHRNVAYRRKDGGVEWRLQGKCAWRVIGVRWECLFAAL
jgi:putative transcriptional regulator